MAASSSILPSSSSSRQNGSARSNEQKRPTYRAAPKRKTFSGWLTGLVTKLALWYSIVTILLRCPRDISELTDTSPRICRPYLQLHELATPYVQPYYTTYLEPHVAKVQPYVDAANHRVVQPATVYYNRYGAPQVTRASRVAQEQWTRHIVPQLASVRNTAFNQYSATLGPHIQKVDDLVRPYYSGITSSGRDLWELEIRPVYRWASPYVRKGYNKVDDFAVRIVLPYGKKATGAVWNGVSRHILPTVQVLYGENVEPQIMRIKQRLGRYRDEKAIEAAVSSVELSASSPSSTVVSSSSTKAITPSSANIVSSSTATTSTKSSSSVISSSVAAPEASHDSKTPSELFADDLNLWERQVSKAVEQGAEHLKERIAEVCEEQTHNQVNTVGHALLIQLEEAESHAVSSLKSAIQTAVSGLPEESSEDDVTEASKDFDGKVRTSGRQLREKAQQVRTWRKQFDTDTTSLVEAAANSTLETVDSIRELRLQDIGRRWASHDDLTHRDWSKYNKLKRTSSQWRESIVDIVLKDDSLANARRSAEEVEERAMGVVEDAAKELSRLKGVALWKLRARDRSDDFESKVLPPVVGRIRDQAAEAVSGISEAVLGSSQGTVESVTSRAAEMASEAAEAVASSASSLASAASASADPMLSSASSASKAYVDPVVSSASSAAASIASSASSLAKPLSSSIDPAISSASSAAGSAVSSASSFASSLSSSVAPGVSSASKEYVDPVAASVSSAAESPLDSASSIAARVSEYVSGAAGDLPSQASSNFESVAESALPNAASMLSSAVSDASSAATEGASSASSAASEGAKVISGAAEGIRRVRVSVPTEEAAEYLSEAMDATEELPGYAEQATESVKSVFAGAMAQAVPDQRPIMDEPVGELEDEGEWAKTYNDIVSGASEVVHGTVAPAIKAAASQASSKLDEALSYASVESALARSRVSDQIQGSPKPIHQKMYASVESAYSEASSRAWSKYNNVAQQTANYALPTQLPYESVSSIASVKLNDALSVASVQYSKAKSAAGFTPTPAAQSALNEAQRRYYEGIGYAHEQYTSYLASASKVIKAAGLAPATTPAFQVVLASAQSQYSVASAAASSVLGEALASASSVAGLKETTPAESVLSAASAQYSAAVSKASTALYGAQTPAYQGMMAAASSRYEEVMAEAFDVYEAAYASAESVAGGAKKTGDAAFNRIAAEADSKYSAASSAAQSAYSAASSEVSQVVYGTSTNQVASASSALSAWLYGTPTGAVAGAVSAASDNWQSLVAAASERVYGTPAPLYASITAQAGSAAAQATSAAGAQYAALSSLVGSLVAGREPAFTDKVLAQLSAAYYTRVPAAASSAASVAGEAASSASSVYADATSALAEKFTPPPALDAILSSASANLDAAVAAVSGKVAPSKAWHEKLSSDAASALSSVEQALFPTQVKAGASKASAAVFGAEKTGALESARARLAEMVKLAEDQAAALGGQASSVAAEAASVVAEAAGKISEAVVGKDEL